jgi:hypothetical protein
VGAPNCDNYETGILHNSHSGREDKGKENNGKSKKKEENRHNKTYKANIGEGLGDNWWCMNTAYDTAQNSAQTKGATITINSAHTGIGGVDEEKDDTRVAGETRPKNMKAVFIMRIE